jgi:hypothetical protein
MGLLVIRREYPVVSIYPRVLSLQCNEKLLCFAFIAFPSETHT